MSLFVVVCSFVFVLFVMCWFASVRCLCDDCFCSFCWPHLLFLSIVVVCFVNVLLVVLFVLCLLCVVDVCVVCRYFAIVAVVIMLTCS